MLFFSSSFFPFHSCDGLSASRCVPQPVSGIIIEHLYTMIILNTVIARLANYSASLFPMYLLNHCHVQFFFFFLQKQWKLSPLFVCGKVLSRHFLLCARARASGPLLF